MHETEISFGNVNKGCLMRKDKELYIDIKWPAWGGVKAWPSLNQIKGVFLLLLPPSHALQPQPKK